MHDLGLAAWFGGSLMGAVGLNGGAATANDPKERLSISSAGWTKWAPAQFAAIGAHIVGSAGMLVGDAGRVTIQKETRGIVVLKTVLTLAAGGASLYSAVVGRKQSEHSDEGAKGATEAAGWESSGLAAAQKQQKILQWVVPAITGVLIVLAAQQGEAQRPKKGLSALLAKKGLLQGN
ncbi:hypothetical protein L3i23_06240 [Herbiconiux sp. L3-i23]|nr:hypothetical protein L3i23_06240 [Herbiconiux sp. L3-i23]